MSEPLHKCFEMLKAEGYDLKTDLFVPIMFSFETGKLSAAQWAIRLEKTIMSKDGKRKRATEHANMILNFCPLCGEKLEEPQP